MRPPILPSRILVAGGLTLACASTLVVPAASAQVQPFPASFLIREIPTNGTTLHVRVGGHGPAVVLLHGYGETGDMWAPLAARLATNHTVVVPDLRGMGLSAQPAGGYDKKTQGHDIAGVLDVLKLGQVDLVTHDIGNMVGYAFAAEYPGRVQRFVIIDAPLPGIGPWDQITRSHALWHFSFWGPDAERLVKGRERIYLDRFWNEFSADPKHFPEASREHYAALYARPGAMHAGFEQFKAFDQDAIDNKAFAAQGPLTMPVLAVGGEKSFDTTMAVVMHYVATDVHGAVVPGSGHWVMEENPAATMKLVTDFLAQPAPAAAAARGAAGRMPPNPAQIRVTPRAFDSAKGDTSVPGTSGVAGIRTTTLKGDPSKAGLYTILLRVPAHTRIAPHTHPDDRDATVVSGTWYFGYGREFVADSLRALPPGSFYTEPPGDAHFAETRDSAVIVQITGFGPTGTSYVRPEDAPPR
jgi:pimeloyl-ACP methyl ester carboxylesterase/quercetin dioxygenase-like cupin family protein